MKKVFHFVPSLDIGGVEIAIKKSLPDLKHQLEISIFYVKRRGSLVVGQRPWWNALKNIIVDKPDIVITSLWWSHPLGFLFKLSGVRWVCFIHNSRFKHFVDRCVCTLSLWCADEVAVDSNQAAVFVRSIKSRLNVRVIPYVFLLPQGETEINRIKNSFIYVGRNAREKRMDLVVGFFKHLLANFPDVTCLLAIASDIPASVFGLIEQFGKRVIVKSGLSNNEVFDLLSAAEYFVVLSDLEGFCMTAYEAVQAGCFVIYRDVGEIKNYVIPGYSFKMANLDNFYNQFDDVFIKRNKNNPVRVGSAGPKLRSELGITYISSFMALAEGVDGNKRGSN